MVAVHFADSEDRTAIKRHWEKITPYLWQSANGTTSGGTNGTQLWDTAFTVIATEEAGLARNYPFRRSLQKALQFLDVSQFRDDLPDPYRQQRKVGWPFSTRDNGYVVSDAPRRLKATIMLQEE